MLLFHESECGVHLEFLTPRLHRRLRVRVFRGGDSRRSRSQGKAGRPDALGEGGRPFALPDYGKVLPAASVGAGAQSHGIGGRQKGRRVRCSSPNLESQTPNPKP